VRGMERAILSSMRNPHLRDADHRIQIELFREPKV